MMADKQGLLGARTSEPDDGSTGAGEREAYEEDWYRSLRALAERQQHLAGQEDDEEEPEDETPADAEAIAFAEAAGGSADVVPDAGLEELPTELEEMSTELEVAPLDEGPDGGITAPVFTPVVQETIDEQAAPIDGETEAAPDLDVEPPPDAALPADDELPAGDERREPHLQLVTEPLAEDGQEFIELGTGEIPSEQDETEALSAEAHEVEAPPTDWDDAALVGASDGEAEQDGAFAPASRDEENLEPPTLEPPVQVEQLEQVEPAPEAPAPSLTSTDPSERRLALEALATEELSDADTHRIEALLLDPETDIRQLALQTLARRPDRVDEEVIGRALQDPTDEVRALAVELAAKRRDVGQIAGLLSARDWPLTQHAVLRLLPEVVAAATVDDETLRRVLDAVGEIDPAPSADEVPALGQLALALGSRRIVDALSWPDVPRLGAIRLLSRDRSPAVLRELAAYDGDPNDEIRTIAASAAAELAAAEAARERVPTIDAGPQLEEENERIASLARALLDEDGTVRHLALSGLAGMERAAIAAWVRDAIASGDPSQLSLAASTAQMLRLVEGAADILDAAAELPVDARHALMDTLTSFVMPPDQLAGLLAQVREPVQAEAIRMLWHVGGPPLLPHLRPYLDDPSAPVRMAVLDVFTESADPAAVDVARIALETDVSPVVRARAIRAHAQAPAAPPAGTVIRALSDPDPEVRATAIESLPDVDGPEAMDALTSSLSDQDDRVRLAAAKRLATRAADPELVWSALRRAPDAGRGEIIASFERVRSGSLTQIALERLRAPEQEERILAVEVCGWGASPGCVEGAIQSLQDPSALVRRTATVSLGRLRDPAAAKALGKALGDPDPEVRIGVVRALGVIDDEAVLGFLVSALNDPDPRVRDVTSQVLTEWSSPAVARRLAGVLAVPRLREAATDLLTRIGAPAVELLIDVLMQHNPAVVPTVGELLQRIAQPDEFLSRLDAVEPERRLRGVEALGAIGGPTAADALLRSLSDPDERIRGRAAQLLAELGDPRARDALTGLLRDPIPGVVAAAQDALVRLG
jgi:HEAT repeat protein